MRSRAEPASFEQRDVATANDFIYRIEDMCAVTRAASDLPMTPSSLVIVTDRGSLKAYRVNETPTRGPSLQLVQAFNMTDAHGRLIDKVSDLGRALPGNRRRGHAPRAGVNCRAHAVGHGNGPADSERVGRPNRENCFAKWKGRLVICSACGNPRGDRRFVASRCATANCRTREIGFGESRSGQTDQSFPIVAADLNGMLAPRFFVPSTASNGVVSN